MKRYTTILLAAALLAGCEKEIATPAEGYGTLALQAECVPTVEAATRAGQTELPGPIPAVEDLTLTVESLDPEHPYVRVWEHVGSYDSQTDYLFATKYRLVIRSGAEPGADRSPEGEDAPYFEGSTETTVAAGKESTHVTLRARLANTVVRVKFTDRFKGYFAGGAKFTLTTAAGKECGPINYETEGTCYYVRPARFTIAGEATKQRPSATQPAPTVKFAETVNETPAPCTLYDYTFDVTDAGAGQVQITLNDTPIRTETLADEELNDDAKPDEPGN